MLVKKLVAITVLVAAMVVFAGGVRLMRVHDANGEWRLVPTETPPHLATLGRDYDRSALPPTSSRPTGLVPRGETDGGGTILVPDGVSETAVPVVVYVEDDEGQFWTYGLVGGP